MRLENYNELLRFLTGIDMDGVADATDRLVVEDVCAEVEAFGRGAYVAAAEWKTIRRLHREQAPAYYDE